ncbi:hypothetical protein ABES02_29525 [Neobacillus pocheonensis]|uniref:hypothetical protein n=1 Tax=Neobacillus pocheonensis TaxID=363869 RepID=UPI003D26AB86
MNQQYWQATALASEIKVHYTTVNNWFNQMEDKRIHYVTRAQDGDRVFDELDLKIAFYIKAKRNEKWSLDAIYNTLHENIETRPFPEDFIAGPDATQLATIEHMKDMFSKEFRALLEHELSLQLAEINNAMAQMAASIQSLPTGITPEEEAKRLEAEEARRLEDRDNRMIDMMTQNRINNTLKIEALEKWAKLPPSERLVRTGLFRKEDDAVKREKFVLEYQQEHFDQRLKKETQK